MSSAPPVMRFFLRPGGMIDRLDLLVTQWREISAINTELGRLRAERRRANATIQALERQVRRDLARVMKAEART